MKKLCTILIVLFTAQTAKSFDPPEFDAWYYQSYKQGLEFSVPDKAQHYWGSYVLTEVGGKSFDRAALVFFAGFLWEVNDDKRGVGFSSRDLIADVLGVVSSIVNSSESTKLWLDYSVADKTISMNVSVVF